MEAQGFRDLVRQAQAGDQQALDRLLSVVRPYLERLAQRYADPAWPSESVSDLVQEAWVRAWRKLDQFRGAADDEQTRAAFLAWAGCWTASAGTGAATAVGVAAGRSSRWCRWMRRCPVARCTRGRRSRPRTSRHRAPTCGTVRRLGWSVKPRPSCRTRRTARSSGSAFSTGCRRKGAAGRRSLAASCHALVDGC